MISFLFLYCEIIPGHDLTDSVRITHLYILTQYSVYFHLINKNLDIIELVASHQHDHSKCICNAF